MTEQSKATVDALGELHGVVAKVLTSQLRHTITNETSGEVIHTAPASTIAAAIAFLKNNNITADPSKNEALAELNNMLRRKHREGKTPLVDTAELMKGFDRDMGVMGG